MLIIVGCSPVSKGAKKDIVKPVSCATAEGDIRSLQAEKAHVGKKIAAGVTAIVPIGLVVNVVTGTEGEHFKVATGEYNKMIDQKIAEIKLQCGM